MRVNDFLIDADFFYSKASLTLVFVNELSGFYKTLWHFGEQEARVDLKGKWVVGARGNSFFQQGKDSLAIGPFVGRKYGPLSVTLWGWRDALKWSSYGLTIQAKGFIKY